MLRDPEVSQRIGTAQEVTSVLCTEMDGIVAHAKLMGAPAHARMYTEALRSLQAAWQKLGEAYEVMAHGDPADYEATEQ